MASFGGWRVSLLHAIGAPVTRHNLRLLAAWQRAEGGSARFNPLNTTQGMAGASNYNSVGVKNYRSAKQGIRATAKTLKNGNYGEIVRMLRHNAAPVETAHAVIASPWGTGSQILDTLKQVGGGGRGGGISHNDLVHYSRKFIGIPYVWGGTTPKGFDCSGFVQYLFAHFGVNLPRTTYEQVKSGHHVSRKNLQPGDIVFFEPGRQGPGHEGMYIGNGKVIEAPHTGANVQIRSLASMSSADTYVTARRIGGVQQGMATAVKGNLGPQPSTQEAANAFNALKGVGSDIQQPQLPGQVQEAPAQPKQAIETWNLLSTTPNLSSQTQQFLQKMQTFGNQL